MNKHYYRENDIRLTCEALGITREEYDKFLFIGNKLHRIYEAQCNGFQDWQGNWNEEASNKADEKEKKLNEKAEALAKEKGLYIFFQSDPRGATIYLDKEPIPYNNYTKAHCIY